MVCCKWRLWRHVHSSERFWWLSSGTTLVQDQLNQMHSLLLAWCPSMATIWLCPLVQTHLQTTLCTQGLGYLRYLSTDLCSQGEAYLYCLLLLWLTMALDPHSQWATCLYYLLLLQLATISHLVECCPCHPSQHMLTLRHLMVLP